MILTSCFLVLPWWKSVIILENFCWVFKMLCVWDLKPEKYKFCSVLISFSLKKSKKAENWKNLETLEERVEKTAYVTQMIMMGKSLDFDSSGLEDFFFFKEMESNSLRFKQNHFNFLMIFCGLNHIWSLTLLLRLNLNEGNLLWR